MTSVNRWFLLVIAIILAGCGNNSDTEPSGFSARKPAGSQNILRYCLGINPTTLDPAKVQDPDTIELLNNIYEPLVNYDEHNKIVGNLASEWTISTDGTVYTFKLVAAKFHDGTDISARDVKASWERALSKEIASPIADTYLGDIVGSGDFAKGMSQEISGIKVIDNWTVQVTIDKARPYFLGKLCYSCCDVLPAKQGRKEITDASQAIGTGPFVLNDIQPELVINLRRFDDYHGVKAAIDGIQRKIVKDPSTRLTMFRNGETDICTVEKQDWKAINDDRKLKPLFKMFPRATVYYLLLSGKAYAPFKDSHVRRAVMMSINRKRIADEILKGAPIANRWLPDGIIDARPTGVALDFNPEDAKKELLQSDYKTGASLPPLELTIRADKTDDKIIAEQVINDLKNGIGLTVKPRTLDEGSMLKARNSGELPCVFLSWGADYLDAQNFLSVLMKTDAPANFDKWSNNEFDKLCSAADIERDAEARDTMYLQAESLVLQYVPRVPLYFAVDGVLIGKRVKGYRSNLLNALPNNKVALK